MKNADSIDSQRSVFEKHGRRFSEEAELNVFDAPNFYSNERVCTAVSYRSPSENEPLSPESSNGAAATLRRVGTTGQGPFPASPASAPRRQKARRDGRRGRLFGGGGGGAAEVAVVPGLRVPFAVPLVL